MLRGGTIQEHQIREIEESGADRSGIVRVTQGLD
jgi:hypothetical protein